MLPERSTGPLRSSSSGLCDCILDSCVLARTLVQAGFFFFPVCFFLLLGHFVVRQCPVPYPTCQNHEVNPVILMVKLSLPQGFGGVH